MLKALSFANFKKRMGRGTLIAIPYTWLLIFFLIPFFIVLKISLAEQQVSIPPYSPLITQDVDNGSLAINIVYYNYSDLFEDMGSTLINEINPFSKHVGENAYLPTYISSIKVAFTTTLFCLLLGYPMAYAVTRAHPRIRNLLLLSIMLPFWTSFLLRVYAWMGLLSTNGTVNRFLLSINAIDKPLDLFYNSFSLNLVMVYTYLPFMILPLYTNLIKLDNRLLEAAKDLGAKPFKAFCSITLPLSKVGIAAGSMMVFIPAVGEYVIPELVGGPSNLMIGKLLWSTFFENFNWPLASALATVMVVILVIPIALFHRYEANKALEEEAKHA